MTNKHVKTYNNLKVMTLNCGGLTQLTEMQIRTLMEQEEIHITLIQETKRTTQHQHAQFLSYNQSGHNVIALTHPTPHYGLQTWINKNYSATFLPKFSNHNSNLEYITTRMHYLLLVNIYRKHTNIVPALQELDQLITKLQHKYPNDTILLAGDFNAQYLPNKPHAIAKHRHFTTWIHQHHLEVASKGLNTRLDPRTHTQTAIDHLLLLPTTHQINEIYLPPFSHILSDHRPLIFQIQKKHPQTIAWRTKFNWKRSFPSILNDILKDSEPTIKQIQTIFQKHSQLNRRHTQCIPVPRHWYKPNTNVKKLIRKAKQQRRHKDPQFRLTQQQLRRAIKLDKRTQFKTFLHNTNKETNQRQFYTNLRYLKTPKPWSTDPAFGQENDLLNQLNYDQEHTRDQTNQITSALQSYVSTTPDSFTPFTIAELSSVLHNLPLRKSPGWDQIPYEFWNQLPPIIHHYILKDINHILTTGHITHNLSHTIIKPIPKSPTTEDIRPISLLPTITKIIEKLLKTRFKEWLQTEGKLTDAQFAYRSKHSAATQIHRLLHNLYTYKQQHKKIAVISLDLKKAFDHVNTSILLTKLIQDKAPTYLVRWMAGTLLNRPIQIVSNHTLSNIQCTSTGVLQGGTLAPMQFTYYINSTIHTSIPDTHSVYAYADDIALMLIADTQHQLEKITKAALHSLIRRLNQIDCEISYQKTKLLTFNCRIPHITYKQERILHVKQHKILGITIDKTLTFNTHTQNMLKRMHTSLQWLKSIAKRFNIQKRRTLALQYVLSVLDYSLLAIYPFLSPSNKKHLNRTISQTARFILQVPSSTPTIYCILEANLTNLEDRAIYLAIQHGNKHRHHPNPICRTLTTTYQCQSIFQTIPPAQRTHLQNSPPQKL
jgi:hypothetical protein